VAIQAVLMLYAHRFNNGGGCRLGRCSTAVSCPHLPSCTSPTAVSLHCHLTPTTTISCLTNCLPPLSTLALSHIPSPHLPPSPTTSLPLSRTLTQVFCPSSPTQPLLIFLTLNIYFCNSVQRICLHMHISKHSDTVRVCGTLGKPRTRAGTGLRRG
jgi:hypothetical protein